MKDLNLWYGEKSFILIIYIREEVTAFIGPSGCGKSTFLRTLNEMNDLIHGER